VPYLGEQIGKILGQPLRSLYLLPLVDRLRYVRFARNEEFAQPSDLIAEGDVIALIPPVAGG